MDLFAHHSAEHTLLINGTLLAVTIVGVVIALTLVVLLVREKR